MNEPVYHPLNYSAFLMLPDYASFIALNSAGHIKLSTQDMTFLKYFLARKWSAATLRDKDILNHIIHTNPLLKTYLGV